MITADQLAELSAKELLDVAVTALAAYEHLTGNRGASMDAFVLHVAELVARAGLATDRVDVIAEPDRRHAEPPMSEWSPEPWELR